jgi:predicted metallo-beta-lactamase superfamily hydrolase
VVGAALSQHVLHGAIGLRLGDVLRTCIPSAYITLISASPVAIWAAVEGITENNFARFAFVGGAVTATGWILALKLLGHPLWHEVVKVGAALRASAGALVRR